MPNCFRLTRKGEREPIALQKLDEELCGLLGESVHPKFWVIGWYAVIGFAIATGKKLGSTELREYVADMPEETERLLKILDYLEENFTDEAWVEVGRRS